jgi:hypothetical protein
MGQLLVADENDSQCHTQQGCDVEEEETIVLTFEEGPCALQKICIARKQKLKKATLTVGFHHDQLNTLPAS